MATYISASTEELRKLTCAESCAALGAGLQGLTAREAAERLKSLGANRINMRGKRNEFLILLLHFRSPLIIILLSAAIISLAMGEAVNASIIILMVMVSLVIDYFQERDARNAAEKLRQRVKFRVLVLRDGIEKNIVPETLVPGDVVRLSSGRIVPADGIVLRSQDFFVDQSSLTGESFPVEKQQRQHRDTDVQEAGTDNLLLTGSNVVTGSGDMLVTSTGGDTEFGRIASRLSEKDEETDFAKGVRAFGFLIMRVTIVLVMLVFLINAFRKHDWLESFMFSLAIAVGMTPELLPMVMTVTMARGSSHMARKGAVVKKLSAIPNFGSMDVLCTDKTGTLTEDRISMIKCVDPDGEHDDELFLFAYLNSHFQTGIQNPLDEAILRYGTADISSYEKTEEISFDFTRKRMSIVTSSPKGLLLICKGAPEEVFKACRADEQVRLRAQQLYESLSEEGFRVLAVATGSVERKDRYYRSDEKDLILQGFIAFLDPPKQDVDETITALRHIGVEVKIITGDNHHVTRKICQEIGLPIKGIMQGTELETLTDDGLRNRVMNTTIFSRFSPEQKTRVIHALKDFHHSVGYLGDGINDAPSLKAADVGISVESATDVAKESADIILTRKDLLILKEGIIEGRKIFGNTMKYILMGLSSNFGNMLSVVAATLFLPFLPMLPSQILVNNFLYDAAQITIPTDHVDEGYTQKPHRWDLKMIYRYMLLFGVVSSVFDIATFVTLYHMFAVDEAQFRTGWFMESLATQILVVFVIRTEQNPLTESRPGKYLVISTLICLGIGWLLPYTPLAGPLGFSPPPLNVLAVIMAWVLSYLICAEFVKRFIHRRSDIQSVLKG